MDNRRQAIDTAIDFTQRALDILDSVGDVSAAAHLQAALNAMTDAPIPRTIEEADAMLQTPEAQAIVARWDPDRKKKA